MNIQKLEYGIQYVQIQSQKKLDALKQLCLGQFKKKILK